MSADAQGACPSDAGLAAFSEGRLDPGTRDGIAEHALRCPECRDVIASIGHRLAERDDGREKTARWRWAAAAACAVIAVTVGGFGIRALRSPPPAHPGTGELARAAGERRLVEGRLSGGFVWAPREAVRGAGGAKPDPQWEISAVAAQISGSGGGDAHALGVAHLLLGNLDEAIQHLERAARVAPGDPTVGSDLAAALIERGKHPDRAEDLVRGLDAAERVLGFAPELPVGRFNKALALEELGLEDAAIEAWQEYERSDPKSEWSREARERVARLRAVPAGPSWAEDTPAFERACEANDVGVLEELIRRHPQQAADSLIAGLGTWAELALAGSPKEAEALARVASGAARLTGVIGDPLVEAATDEIQAAPPDRRRRLAQAHQKLAQGRAALDDVRAAEGKGLLHDAATRFEKLRSPTRDFAELYELSSSYYLGASKHFLPQLEILIGRHPIDHPSIVGSRARWLQGLALGVSGQPFESIAILGQAAAGLESLGFRSDATFVRSIEATNTWYLGQTARAWPIHRSVFERLRLVIDPRRSQSVVSQAAVEAGTQDLPYAALALQQAGMRYSHLHDTPMDHCDGLVWLARAAARAGRSSLAVQVAHDARAALDTVPDEALRARLDAELSLVEGRLRRATDSAGALEAADRAVRWFESVEKKNHLVEAYRLRAQVRADAGDSEAARLDYEAAMRTTERQRDRLGESFLRTSYLDTIWGLARDAVAFELDRGNPAGALETAERLRATALARPARRQGAARPVEALRRSLRSGEAVVFYSVLHDRTMAWVIRTESIQPLALPIAEQELIDEVEASERAITSGPPEGTLAGRRRLFARLIEPLAPLLEGARRVVIVPDGCLHRVPWAALIDPRRGRAWVDDVAVAVAPALRNLAGSRGAIRDPSKARVVAVGDPSFDSSLYGELPRLPGAEREAREIGALYPHATVLTGAEANADRVLSEAARARVLHVAAHAIANRIDPELSTIVLAPGGTTAPSGGLTARQIRGRPMDQLDVVILAACRTGDGPASRMEGPLSLARPFLENGARAVIVSLWDLPDEGGASIMRALHGHLRSGEAPIEALQRSARACWSGPRPDPRTCGGLQLVMNEPL